MSKWFSPFYVTIALTILFIASAFTSFADKTNMLALYIVLSFITIFIHELGHVVFALLAGYHFHFMTIGPITIENNGKLKIVPNHSWTMFGGAAYCMPKNIDSELTKKHLWYAAGGPLFSLGTALIFLLISLFIDHVFVFTTFLLNAAIFFVTILPTRMSGGLYSDGYICLMLIRGGKKAEQYVATLLLTKELMSPKKPLEWSQSFIEEAKGIAPSTDNILVAYTIFYYELSAKGYEAASQAIDGYKMIPLTNKNKLLLQLVTQVRQIDSYKSNNPDTELITSLHKQLSKVEPISYKRSEALLATLQGNERLAEKRLQEALEQCEQGVQQYGFLEAEKQLTAFVYSLVQTYTQKPPISSAD